METTILKSQLILPCGATLKNRIAKSAMSENMSPKHHGPTENIIRVYQKWVNGGAGLIITGNVMIDGKAIAEPGNVLVEDKSNFDLLKKWAAVTHGTATHLWPQINHPGRQAMGFLNKEVVGPSAVKLNLKGLDSMFKKPRALTEPEILEIIERFGNTAAILKEAGFTGVQIHAAHGYLISQFLSPLVNHREDQWGGTLENRARLVLEIYRDIRSKVGPSFPVGIKINSADFQRGGFTQEESIEVIKMLGQEGIDLIEISGGTYEKPAMTGFTKKQSTIEREAYFLDYIQMARELLKTPLMLTGGFRTASTMERVINDGELDVIGLARPFSIYPDLPNRIFDGSLAHLEIPRAKSGLKVLDKSGFLEIKWHEMQIQRMGKGKEPKPNLSAYPVIWSNIVETGKKLLFG